MMAPRVHLESYCKVFNDRALGAAISLFSEHALFEMPLLGQRLFGTAEINAGLQRIFAVTESASIDISSVKEAPTLVIAEGRLKAKLHRDTAPVEMPMAISLEAKDGKISRLSTYLDARPYRLWSDGPIFAHPSASSN